MLSLSVSACAALLLAQVGLAAPTHPSSPPKCPSYSVNANFDDLSPLPGASLSPVPTPYKGLFFQAFNYAQSMTLNTLPGLVAHSPPNYAYTFPTGQTTAGTPMLTTNYPDSNTTSFSLSSFYFGCAIGLFNSATAPPTPCLLSFTGYKGNDNSVSAATQVCSQQFQYNPSTMLGPQQLASSGALLSCFKDVQFAIVTLSPVGGMAALGADVGLILDDVKYSYSTC